ncbi:MAG: PEP-CTERM system TPR-repeat protein PrsT [Rhodospirillales bacterium]|nr:PEP-CTERM system TPR-repeat protein PrsT [Rhodospirillales bacterium]
MKKVVIAAIIVVVLAGGAGAAWWKYVRRPSPLAQARIEMTHGNLPAAELLLRRAVREDPRNGEAHLRLGLVQFRLGDAAAAEREFRLARESGYQTATATRLLAETYMQQGKFRQLLEQFPVPATPDKSAVPLLVMRGMAQLNLGQLAQARTTLVQAAKLGPDLADPQLALARLDTVQHNLKDAEAAVDRALAINENNPPALLLKAQLLNGRGQRSQAISRLDQAIKIAPTDIALRLERANMLIEANQDKLAAEDAAAVLKINPRSAGAVYIEAVLAARAHDYTKADALLTRVQPLFGHFQRAYYFEAVVKFNLGQAEQAISAAEKYVARMPQDPDGVKLLARIDIATQRPESAVEVLNKAVAAGMQDAQMLDLLGQAYGAVGNRAKAVQAFQGAQKLAPDNPDIMAHLAAARLQAGDAAGAAEELKRSLAVAPHNASTLAASVVTALANGDLPGAQKAMAELLKVVPGSNEGVGNLKGLVQMAGLDYAGARATLEAVVKAYPGSVQARVNLARIATMQGRTEDAEKLLGDILATQPANLQVAAALTQLYVANKQLGRAVPLLETAHNAVPANTAVTATLADLYIRVGEPQKALDLLKKASTTQPGSDLLDEAEARADIALKQPKQAEEVLRRVLERSPNNASLRIALAGLMVQRKDFAGARTAIDAGMKLAPHDYRLVMARINLEKVAGGAPAALKEAQSLAADPANRPIAPLIVGDTQMSLKMFKEAVATYEDEFKRFPSTALALRLSAAQQADHLPTAAGETLRAWLSAHPQDVPAMLALGSLDLTQKNLAEAQTMFEQATAKGARDALALNNLAWIYQQKGDPRAVATAQQAYLLDPAPPIADTLGWILVGDGQADKALPLLRMASAAATGDPAIVYHYAVALAKTGSKTEAASVLKSLLAHQQAFADRAAAQKLYETVSAGH